MKGRPHRCKQFAYTKRLFCAVNEILEKHWFIDTSLRYTFKMYPRGFHDWIRVVGKIEEKMNYSNTKLMPTVIEVSTNVNEYALFWWAEWYTSHWIADSTSKVFLAFESLQFIFYGILQPITLYVPHKQPLNIKASLNIFHKISKENAHFKFVSSHKTSKIVYISHS